MPKKNKSTTNKSPGFQKKSAEYSQFRFLRIIGAFLYLLLILVFSGTFWFLYKNMYQTIGQIVTLSDLDQVTATERIDTGKLDSVLDLQLYKDSQEVPKVARDPFSKFIPIVEVPENTEL